MNHREWKDVPDVRSAKEDLEHQVNDWLRARGWKYTSSTPGSLWLWEREHEGRVLLVNTESALHMQAWFDMIACACTEDGYEPAPDCPIHRE